MILKITVLKQYICTKVTKSRYFYTESNGIDLLKAINNKLKSHDRKNDFHNINSYNNNMKNKLILLPQLLRNTVNGSEVNMV